MRRYVYRRPFDFGQRQRLKASLVLIAVAAPANFYNIYRGAGGLANVDWSTPVDTADVDAGEITLVGLGHAVSTRYTYGTRPVIASSDLETPDFTNIVEFETDASGDWLGNRPTGPAQLIAEAQSGGDIKVTWTWRRAIGEDDPNDFGVYYSTSPSITPGSPDAIESFAAEGQYSHTFSLTGGQAYWFAVTARTAGGVESPLSRIIGPVLADATAPDAPVVTVTTRF